MEIVNRLIKGLGGLRTLVREAMSHIESAVTLTVESLHMETKLILSTLILDRQKIVLLY